MGGALVEGAPYLLARIGLLERLRDADLVVTGEGTVDRTTAEGKGPAAVARAARDAGVRCVVFGGRVLEPLPGAETVALSGDPARAREDLEALAEGLVALV
jgi:glycerate kinase